MQSLNINTEEFVTIHLSDDKIIQSTKEKNSVNNNNKTICQKIILLFKNIFKCC
jgi:hypothetical protein